MNIIQCYDCGGDLSLSVYSCPHCGCSKWRTLREGIVKDSCGKKDLTINAGRYQKKGSSSNYSGWYHLTNESHLYCLFQIQEGKKSGYEAKFWSNGNCSSEGFLRNGNKIGDWTFWYTNGEKRRAVKFLSGKPIFSQTWYSSGERESEEEFENGSKKSAIVWLPTGLRCELTDLARGSGTQVMYHENGLIEEKRFYANGKIDGIIETFSEKGNIVRVSNFKKGQKNGVWKSFDKNNNLISERNFKNGRLDGLSRFFLKGFLFIESNYKNGLSNGTDKEFYLKSEQIKEERFYINGQRIFRKKWYISGKPEEEVNFDEYGSEELHGPQIKWHENGNPKELSFYKFGQIVGPQYTWSQDGADVCDDLTSYITPVDDLEPLYSDNEDDQIDI